MSVSKRTVDTNYRTGLYEALMDGFQTFLNNENTVTFYAMLCDVCPKTGEVIVSMNTEFDYQRRQRQHQSQDIRYNTDFWHYQAIVQSKPVEQQLIEKYYTNNEDGLLQLVTLTLKDFTKTNLYKSIRKTSDFKWICQFSNPTTSHINL